MLQACFAKQPHHQSPTVSLFDYLPPKLITSLNVFTAVKQSNMPSSSNHLAGWLVAGRYRVGNQISLGSCGTVYKGTDEQNGSTVAIKVEHSLSSQQSHTGLMREKGVYLCLQNSGVEGFPRPRYYGTLMSSVQTARNGVHKVLVMDFLGKDLESYLKSQGGRCPVAEVLHIGIQALSLIRKLHSVGYIHRDIKPSNFLVDRSGNLTLIDFDLAARFRSKGSKRHIPFHDGVDGVGTPMFASVATHSGVEASRRDDLESLVYSLLYLRKGSVPWVNERGDRDPGAGDMSDDDLDDEEILDRKEEATEDTKTLFQGLPRELKDFYQIVSCLRFEEKPDYSRLEDLLRRASSRR